MNLSRWYGAIGFTWWCYKEFYWFDVETDMIHKVWENYFGIVRRDTVPDEPKVVDTAFQSFNPNSVCNTCTLPDTSIYYHPYKLPQLVVSGKVFDEDSVGIKNALMKFKAMVLVPTDTTIINGDTTNSIRSEVPSNLYLLER